MYDFQLVKPSSVAEAIEALGAEDAQALGGGQTLLPTMKARLAQTDTLVSLAHVEEMKGVCTDDAGRLCVGGGTTHAAAAEALKSDYPALSSLAARIGDPAVRARGTMGGSVANDDPSACWPAGVLGSGATVVAAGKSGTREIGADDFFQGMFTTALEEGEIITEIRFPVPEKAAYEKMIQPASRFPLVAAYVAKFADGVRVAITGASSDGVFRWTEAETALSQDFSAEAVKGLAAPDAGGMISDLHGSAEYRAHLCKVMTARAVKAAG
ncbi:xanthine dehydrogenase family protein subunit M [Jannaschia sp. Os4]|uniref:FAD binding domain-containing protein n=1 Tax=Jannaschia sp. Os4 TaxID=2807617 RepID=UPI001939A422|nr:xanthine dehydrogenase family protein subunit M [Jannaschia sp. Os4]MBM2577673.1 xanthine dehydrogenase family protein subunit M [Jannaschia sp. Os4]